LLWSAAACVLGALTIVYLPVRAAAGAPMWGDPTTWSGWLAYVSGSAYGGNLGAAGTEGLIETVGYVLAGAGGVGVLGAVFAVVSLRHEPPAVRLPLYVLAAGTLAAIVPAMLQPLEPINPDNVAYSGPAVALLIAAGAAGLVALARQASQARRIAVAIGLIVIAVSLPSLHRARSTIEADVTALETLGGSLTDAPPPRALVLTTTDFAGSTWMMARAVDGARPDVAFFATGLATSSWHWRTLAPHPAFDGTPARGAGRDARARYVEGAVRTALGRVAILAEDDAPVSGRGRIDGPYLHLPADTGTAPPAAPAAPRSPPRRLFGERLEPAIASDARRSPPGDAAVADAILHHHRIRRAHRLVVRRRPGEALGALADALHRLPRAQRALVRVHVPRGTSVGFSVPVVRDPRVFLASTEDVVREAAVLLAGVGHADRAHELLAAQSARGDSRGAAQAAAIANRIDAR
jgi:hypothetical protein